MTLKKIIPNLQKTQNNNNNNSISSPLLPHTVQEYFPVIIIVGMSGAGKSTALHVFEDLQLVTADGIPPSLVTSMIHTVQSSSLEHVQGLALGINQHRIHTMQELEHTFQEMRSQHIYFTLLYLEADMPTLIKRYAATRRPHPLEQYHIGLEHALEEEAKRLIPIRQTADIVLDTTTYSIHDLRRFLQKSWNPYPEKIRSIKINIISFGFKYGVPNEADLLFDLRFLPNPYFVEELRPLSGMDKKVATYVLNSASGIKFKKHLIRFLSFLLPLYDAEGRYRITIALGCTGGKHRSVAISELLLHELTKKNYTVSIEHRHMELG
ncbi:RNase adapter RapZ [Lawsonia intracellularis]|uniref:RNase adapter RapZ n=1 Tax=Lawsonia intracellularis TaxID=29546 RepID=UPI000DE492CF|nr:RNase adapter RapZ [Lawsonia intracellularis]MBZ3892090.1 RNase adapter RapZ [Lawsonia intracellularis]RBN34141.1 RNase adapter RapZ [Lawsonia intracellularis]UYH53384.1 RNase adapter RapZ [Lawsonia intracellularis]